MEEEIRSLEEKRAAEDRVQGQSDRDTQLCIYLDERYGDDFKVPRLFIYLFHLSKSQFTNSYGRKQDKNFMLVFIFTLHYISFRQSLSFE